MLLLSAFFDSIATVTEYWSPETAPARFHVRRQPGGFALVAIVGAWPFSTGGLTIKLSPASADVAKRQVTGTPSGSVAGMNCARTPPVWSWMIAGTAVIGLPVLPVVASTLASTRNDLSPELRRLDSRQQL